MRNDIDRERTRWEKRYGTDWVRGLEGLRHWANGEGIAIQAGSSELLVSDLAATWGWGGLPGLLYEESLGTAGDLLRVAGSWVLRVPPGRAERVRERIEGDRDLAPRAGIPYIQVEETSLAHLPTIGSSSARWPSPEAWHRAAILLDPRTRPGHVFVPADFGELVSRLALTHAPERVALDAWDRWRAAAAWDLDRDSYWMVRRAVGAVPLRAEGGWLERASTWGVRALEPVVVWFTRLGSKDGTAPFLPNPVIAHNPRPAVLRSEPARLTHVFSGGSR